MLLRLFRGHVVAGREDDFVALVRRQVIDEFPATPGLVSFMAGYRRVDRSDRFVLASTWETKDDIERSVGPDADVHPRTVDVLAGVAEMERVDGYELFGPVHRGVLDAPGVIRVTEGTIRPGRKADLLAFLERKVREIGATDTVLASYLASRMEDGRERAVGVSAWAGPLAVEAVSDRAREGKLMFAALDAFVTDVHVEQYRTIEIDLPERLREFGGRRLVAARFRSAAEARRASAAITARFRIASEGGVSVAPLGDTQYRTVPDPRHLLVARITLADVVAAERLIADLDGEVVYEADEPEAVV